MLIISAFVAIEDEVDTDGKRWGGQVGLRSSGRFRESSQTTSVTQVTACRKWREQL